MTTTRAPAAGPPDSARRRGTSLVPWIGLVVALVVIAASVLLPSLLGWEVYSRAHPENTPGSIDPLHSIYDPTWFGPGTIPALLLALLGWRYAADLSSRLPWRHLLAGTYVASLAWLVSLALVSGRAGLTDPLAHEYEYLQTAREVDDIPAFLHEFVSRIPLDSTNNWTTHVAGHPPGATLFFVVLDRLGLAGDLPAALVVVLLAASTATAVLVTLRTLGVEDVARRVAPFLVLTPAAIWMAVSADGMFGAVAAWGIAALALAATSLGRRLVGFSVVAGLLLGGCVMLSYGLPILGVLAVAVLAAARSWRPLPVAAGAATAVVLAFAVAGFRWWEAYPVLTDRYWDGTASERPGAYWTWGDLGSLFLSGGPLLGAGLAVLIVLVARRDLADRVPLLLAGAGLVMVLAADLSQMSRGEVERIWLPFVPWLTISLALVPERWRRWGLGLQVVVALLLEHLLYTSW